MRRSVWRTGLLWLVAAAFLASLFGLWKGLTVPATKTETENLLSYDIEGTFSHRVYGTPVQNTSIPNPKYFAKLIDSIEMSYTYDFVPKQPVKQWSAQVKIVAQIAGGLWNDEMTLLESSPITADANRVVFPINTASFGARVSQIVAETGMRATSPEITLQATVNTSIETEQGLWQTELVHPLEFRYDSTTLEWGRGLASSRRGYFKGLEYTEKGHLGLFRDLQI